MEYFILILSLSLLIMVFGITEDFKNNKKDGKKK